MFWGRNFPRLEQLIREATFPVYGLLGNPFNLLSAGWGSFSFEESGNTVAFHVNHNLSLRFGTPHLREAQRAVELRSERDQPAWWEYWIDWRQFPVETPFYDQEGKKIERYATLELAKATWVTDAPILLEQISLAGQQFWGILQYWPRHQNYLFTFTPENNEGTLRGEGAGLSKQELLKLFEHIAIINHRPDIIAQYQDEVDRWRDFFSK